MLSGIPGAWAGWYRAASSPGYVPCPARRSRVSFPHWVFLKSGYSSHLPFQSGVRYLPPLHRMPNGRSPPLLRRLPHLKTFFPPK